MKNGAKWKSCFIFEWNLFQNTFHQKIKRFFHFAPYFIRLTFAEMPLWGFEIFFQKHFFLKLRNCKVGVNGAVWSTGQNKTRNMNFIFCWNELLTYVFWKITWVFLFHFAPGDFAFHTAPFATTFRLFLCFTFIIYGIYWKYWFHTKNFEIFRAHF
jgi:hypothetical protein